MTEAEFIRLLQPHFENLFPKICHNCERVYPTLKEYVRCCNPAGQPVCYDAELKDWKTDSPLGAILQANCPCGNTLALGTAGMPLVTVHVAFDWIRSETERRGLS